ncbi:MAG: AAA family ATPase [Acidobacteria bacterium]|nr:AAA family ATPase [Acidobacteriota bacterium]
MKSVIALLAQKGGVGKSSLAVALAVANDLGGGQSALVDLDPQGTTTVWGRLRPGALPEVFSAHPPRLRRVVEEVGDADATAIVIDTAPRERAGAVAAAEIADVVLVPCRPAAPDLAALPATLEVAEEVGTRAVVVLNQAPPRGPWITDARDAVRESGAEVCPVIIGQRVAHAKAFILGKTAQELEPASKAAAEIGELHDWIIRRAT